jgi:hypothetical protein
MKVQRNREKIQRYTQRTIHTYIKIKMIIQIKTHIKINMHKT